MSENLLLQGELTVITGNEYTYACTLTNDYKVKLSTVLTYVQGNLTKSHVGLSNVDNTSDVNKPVSLATQAQLDTKQPLDSDLTAIAALSPAANDMIQRVGGAWTNRSTANVKLSLTLNKTDVGLSNVDNTSDVNKPVSTATALAISTAQSIVQASADQGIAAAATAQSTANTALANAATAQGTADSAYALAGTKQDADSDLTTIASLAPANDNLLQRKAGVWTSRTPAQFKTDLALTKSDVGLSEVDNTTDINKPVSTATQTALNLKQSLSEKGAANGYAPLDASGLIPASYIPSLAITDTFVVNSQTEMLQLSSANKGDLAIRTDTDRVYILTVVGGYATLGNWTLLPVPASSVLSVNGYTGVVTLAKSDIGLGNVDNTSDANKPISIATQTALNNKQALSSELTTLAAIVPAADDLIQRKAGVWVNRTPSQVKTDLALTKSDVGLSNVDNTSDANKPISTATQTALNNKQALNTHLTTISGLTPTNDDVMQYKAGAWANRTLAQLKTDLNLTDENIQDMIAAFILAGNNVALTYNDAANSLTVGVTAAGSDTYIQYNNAGLLGSSVNFKYDSATQSLHLLGGAAGINTQTVTTAPGTTAAGEARIFTQKKAGKTFLRWIGDVGGVRTAQPHFAERRISIIQPNSGNAPDATGIAFTTQGTVATVTPTSGSLKNQTFRNTYRTANGSGSVTAIRSTNNEIWRGNAAGYGGFELAFRGGLDTLGAGNRGFFGVSSDTNNTSNHDPLTDTSMNRFGFAFNANTGNWSFVTNTIGSAPTVTNLGANFPIDTTTMYDMAIYCPSNASWMGYYIKNLNTGAETSGIVSSNLPTASTFLSVRAWMTNNATSGQLYFYLSKIYLESAN